MSDAKSKQIKNQTKPEKQIPESRKKVSELVQMNIIFWLFCALMLIVAWFWVGEGVGLLFFFVYLGCAFTVVSIFDLIYDRFSDKNKENDNTQNT